VAGVAGLGAEGVDDVDESEFVTQLVDPLAVLGPVPAGLPGDPDSVAIDRVEERSEIRRVLVGRVETRRGLSQDDRRRQRRGTPLRLPPGLLDRVVEPEISHRSRSVSVRSASLFRQGGLEMGWIGACQPLTVKVNPSPASRRQRSRVDTRGSE
jgi:hypothetical protein